MNTSSPDPGADWWYTVDVAAYLGVAVATVSGYRRLGLCRIPPAQRAGRTYRWRPAVIVDWHGRRPGVGGRYPPR